ncbi:MAG TPA: hypothetical protein VLG27_03885 [Candidatus Saccharimonadia bacterium]|nr:hypothetical protein [Candidatus Saccharimonadia bacterium]
MAKVTVEKVKRRQPVLYKESSSARLSARKIGLDIPEPNPSPPKTEFEATDTA